MLTSSDIAGSVGSHRHRSRGGGVIGAAKPGSHPRTNGGPSGVGRAHLATTGSPGRVGGSPGLRNGSSERIGRARASSAAVGGAPLLQEARRQARQGRGAGRIFGERVPPGFRAGRTKVGVGAGVSAST